MLRVILVAGPQDDQLETVAEALASTPLTAVYMPRSMMPAAVWHTTTRFSSGNCWPKGSVITERQSLAR